MNLKTQGHRDSACRLVFSAGCKLYSRRALSAPVALHASILPRPPVFSCRPGLALSPISASLGLDSARSRVSVSVRIPLLRAESACLPVSQQVQPISTGVWASHWSRATQVEHRCSQSLISRSGDKTGADKTTQSTCSKKTRDTIKSIKQASN